MLLFTNVTNCEFFFILAKEINILAKEINILAKEIKVWQKDLPEILKSVF